MPARLSSAKIDCAARVAPEEPGHPARPAAYTSKLGATREVAIVNRFTTKAGPPLSPLPGSWPRVPAPEPTQSPGDLPMYYPNGLKVRTLDEIGVAIKLFPHQSQIFDLCRRVISKLTPAFCAEVRAARLRADLAPSHMGDLLHCLLVYNVRNDSERHRLEQDLRGAKEWSGFIRSLKKLENRSQSNSDIARGKKVLQAAQRGHSAVHGTKAEKETRWARYRAEVKRQVDSGLTITSARKNTARKLGVSYRTVLNHTKNLSK